ncbi:hypothetical protein [Clostridium cylindrosporum]|uniref:Uncharacterized protein n=1 Tax=Clostridium cylindrosporum DSM 605 TaxID=1121307 RepID=A0A0J8D8I2_CLOCY|nr:hypothetical protein [Clostridium cylindrosporum]KMT22187.1 hypothetical protein CLCY_4c01600 [Clostridium cylindrosporum DSM 605]
MLKGFKSKYKLIATITLILLLITSVFIYYYISHYLPIPVSKEEALKYKVIDHFPRRPGTLLTYITAKDSFGVSHFTKQLIKSFPSSSEKNSNPVDMLALYNYEGKKEGAITSYKTFKFQNNSIENVTTSDDRDDFGSTEKFIHNTPKWKKSKNTTTYLTGINLTVNTIGGNFENCIEITSVETLDNGSKVYTTIYSAPNIGFIMKKSGPNLKKQKKVFELYSYNIPDKSLISPQELGPFLNKAFKALALPKDSSTYHNNIMGITLRIPEHWNGKYATNRTVWADNIEETINFHLNMGNKSHQRIFSIHMLKKGYGKSYVDKNPKYVYIGEHNGHTLVYSLAKSLSSETAFTTKFKEQVDKMLSDVPNIIKDIKYD